MIEELVFTSARRGLQVGKSGFCTVASTPGMAANLARLLESLSAYRHLASPGTPDAANNPVVYSHLKSKIGGRTYDIVSRIADAGFDYSNRSNKLAHHFALAENRSVNFGPADLLAASQNFYTTWEGDAKKLSPRVPAATAAGPRPCSTWQQISGDAGIAGDVLEAIAAKRTTYLIVNPDTPALALIGEALALLPLEKQWAVSFSTFFTKLPPSIECDIRCVLAGSAEVAPARRSQSNLVLDLTAPLPTASGKWADAARKGTLIGQPTPERPSSSGAGSPMGKSGDLANPSIDLTDHGTTDINYGTDPFDDSDGDYLLSEVDITAPELPTNRRPGSTQRRGWDTLPPRASTGSKKRGSQLLWIGIPLFLLFALLLGCGLTYLLNPSLFTHQVANSTNEEANSSSNLPNSSDSELMDSVGEEKTAAAMKTLTSLIKAERTENAREFFDSLPPNLKSKPEFVELNMRILEQEAAANRLLSFDERLAALQERTKDGSSVLDKDIDDDIAALKAAFPNIENKQKKFEFLVITLAEARKKRQDNRIGTFKGKFESASDAFNQTLGQRDINKLNSVDCKTLTPLLDTHLSEMKKLLDGSDKIVEGLPRLFAAEEKVAKEEAFNKEISGAELKLEKVKNRLATLTERQKDQLIIEQIQFVRLTKPLMDFSQGDKGTLFTVNRVITDEGITFDVENVEVNDRLGDKLKFSVVRQSNNKWHIIDDKKKPFATLELTTTDKKSELQISQIQGSRDETGLKTICRILTEEQRLMIACGDGKSKEIVLASRLTLENTVKTNSNIEMELLVADEHPTVAKMLKSDACTIELETPFNHHDLIALSKEEENHYAIEISLSDDPEFRSMIPKIAKLHLRLKKPEIGLPSLTADWSYTSECNETLIGVAFKFNFDRISMKRMHYADIVKEEFFKQSNPRQSMPFLISSKINEENKRLGNKKLDQKRKDAIIAEVTRMTNERDALISKIKNLKPNIGFPDDLTIPLKLTAGENGEYTAILNLTIK